jgi:outer membrane protein OmpA-like peptidoglycan-associated protein
MKWQLRANSRLTTPRPSTTPLERRKLLAAELRKLRSSATLDAAEKTKALAEADEAKASTWKERVETLRAAAIGFTVLYGITALFCYCFFIAKFMPSGVTAGDTLLFSFIALALGAIGIVLAAAGVMVWLPVTLPIEPKAKPNASVKGTKWAAGIYAAACVAYLVMNLWASWTPAVGQWVPHCLKFITTTPPLLAAYLDAHLGLVLLAAWALIAILSSLTLYTRGAGLVTSLAFGLGGSVLVLLALSLVRFPQGLSIVGGAIIGGEFLAFALDPTIGQGADRKSRPFGQTVALAALGLIMPVFMIAVTYSDRVKPSISSITFGNLGLYADDAAMEVTAANLQTLVAAADLQGDALDICRGPEGSAVVTGLKVWWHGIGTRSHVELPRADGPGVVVDLDTSQARLIRNHRARCMDLPGTYFDSGAESMTEDGRKQLLDAVQRWTQREMKDTQLEQIRVVGHTDPMTPAVGTTNRTLSNDRAQAVMQVLQDSGVLRGFFVRDTESLAAALRIEGDAARQPLKECPANSSLSERRECNAVNRRVELRFLFGPKSTPGQAVETASSAATAEQASSAAR